MNNQAFEAKLCKSGLFHRSKRRCMVRPQPMTGCVDPSLSGGKDTDVSAPVGLYDISTKCQGVTV